MAHNFISELQPTSETRSKEARGRHGFFRRNAGRLIGFGLLLAVIALVTWWRARPEPVRYVTEPVSRGAVVQSIATTGTVNPVVTVQVGSYVSGVIQSLYCDYNTRVKAGQLCAKIDPRPYKLKVDEDAANLASAQAQLAKDKASRDYARGIYRRDLSLLDKKLISQDTVDSDKSKYDQAQAQIGLDEATIQQRQASLDASQVNLSYTDIVSPVDGVVISRNIDVGQTVAASFQTPTLFLIAKDLTHMLVDTNVSESDVGEARVGQKASFTVEAYPQKTFWGQVTQVRQAPITVQNVVTYDVVVSVENPNLELLPGMTANVRIITAEHDDVQRVPLQAIRFTPGGFAAAAQPEGGASHAASRGTGRSSGGERPSGASPGTPAQVWVLYDGKPHAVPVMTGLRDNTHVEITGGDLQPGEEVIVNETGSAGTAARPGARMPFRL
jgi:HlyD family secretion protein